MAAVIGQYEGLPISCTRGMSIHLPQNSFATLLLGGATLPRVREDAVVPPGLKSFLPLVPALKSWAKLERPSGAGDSDSWFPWIVRKRASLHDEALIHPSQTATRQAVFLLLNAFSISV